MHQTILRLAPLLAAILLLLGPIGCDDTGSDDDTSDPGPWLFFAADGVTGGDIDLNIMQAGGDPDTDLMQADLGGDIDFVVDFQVSPDGQWASFRGSIGSGPFSLYILPIDSDTGQVGTPQEITFNETFQFIRSVVWSPNSDFIAFRCNGESSDISNAYITALTSGTWSDPIQLNDDNVSGGDVNTVDVSSDGSLVVFDGDIVQDGKRGFYVVPITEGTPGSMTAVQPDFNFGTFAAFDWFLLNNVLIAYGDGIDDDEDYWYSDLSTGTPTAPAELISGVSPNGNGSDTFTVIDDTRFFVYSGDTASRVHIVDVSSGTPVATELSYDFGGSIFITMANDTQATVIQNSDLSRYVIDDVTGTPTVTAVTFADSSGSFGSGHTIAGDGNSLVFGGSTTAGDAYFRVDLTDGTYVATTVVEGIANARLFLNYVLGETGQYIGWVQSGGQYSLQLYRVSDAGTGAQPFEPAGLDMADIDAFSTAISADKRYMLFGYRSDSDGLNRYGLIDFNADTPTFRQLHDEPTNFEGSENRDDFAIEGYGGEITLSDL